MSARHEDMRDILTLSSHRASPSLTPPASKRHPAVEPNGPPHIDVTQVRLRSRIQYTLRFGKIRHEILRTKGIVLEIVGVCDQTTFHLDRYGLASSIC